MLRSLVATARRTRNCLLSLIDTPVVVLAYHRVTALSSDPQLLAVSPENFRAQMRYLKDTFPLVRFEQDWAHLKLPSIAVTFDDGYADNVLEALPILEETGVPATFFVSTGNLGSNREYWWDELERIITAEGSFPENFSLDDRHFGRVWSTGTSAGRNGLYQQLLPLMKKVDHVRREDWLTQLHRWAQVGESGRAAYRVSSNDELQRLADSKLVTVGAHTETHTRLSLLSEEQQRNEIFTSKQKLEKITGREIKTFSYPYGRRNDYNRISVRLCREAGFIKAAANFSGLVHRWSDPLQLPRHLVRNWDRETFSAEVKGFWQR